MRVGLIAFFIGVLLGAGAMWLIPAALAPHMPAFITGPTETMEGVVVAKRLQADRLLVTIRAPQGTTLVTFTDRLDEIDLLVSEGDSIQLGPLTYEPFLDDPKILRVVKPEPSPEPKPEPAEPLRDQEELYFPG